MILWSVHTCFHWCKSYKNRPRNARVIVEKSGSFFMKHRVYTGFELSPEGFVDMLLPYVSGWK